MLYQALILAAAGMGTVLVVLLLVLLLAQVSHRLCEKWAPAVAAEQPSAAMTAADGAEVADPVLLEVIRAAVQSHREKSK